MRLLAEAVRKPNLDEADALREIRGSFVVLPAALPAILPELLEWGSNPRDSDPLVAHSDAPLVIGKADSSACSFSRIFLPFPLPPCREPGPLRPEPCELRPRKGAAAEAAKSISARIGSCANERDEVFRRRRRFGDVVARNRICPRWTIEIRVRVGKLAMI